MDAGVVVGTNADSAQVGRTGSGWFLCSLTARLPEFTREPSEEQQVLDILLNSPDNPRAIKRLALTNSTRAQTIRISALENATLNPVYTGTGNGAFYAWGAQLELGDQVEFEISSLTYIKTVGGQNSRYGYNIMPADSERLFVGSLHRHRDIWPTRLHNDDRERIDFLIGSNLRETADTAERKQLLITTRAKTDATTTFSGTTVQAGSTSEQIFVGQQGLQQLPGDPQEHREFYHVKQARQGYHDDPNYAVDWIRTNHLTYGEDFRPGYWIKSNASVFRSPLFTSGNLPYRSVTYDAGQIYDLFDVTAPNTYYVNRWYEEVPLSNLPDYTSNVVCDVYETIITGQHLLQARVYNNDTTQDVLSYSVYASPSNGVDRFRMEVNNDVWVEFNLSSVSIVTSNTVFHASIQTIDTSNLVYLCRLVAPAVRITETFSGEQIDNGVVVGTSDLVRIRANFIRTFNETPMLAQDNMILGLVIDLAGGDGTEDYQTLTGGDVDYQIA